MKTSKKNKKEENQEKEWLDSNQQLKVSKTNALSYLATLQKIKK
jgi:hypothetical protein